MEETTSESKDPLLRSSEDDVEEPSESSEKIDVNGGTIHNNEEKRNSLSLEDEAEDDAGSDHSTTTKQQPLVEKPENRKRKTSDITKVVIRHIPKHLKKEEFLEAIGPLPPYNYLSYTTGGFLSRLWNRKSTGFCTVNFVTQEDAFQFVTDHRIFILRDDKGDEHYAATEFAVNQRIPKATYSTSSGGGDAIEALFDDGADALFDGDALFDNAEDSLSDLENDPNYIEFKNVYEASTTGVIGTTVNADGSITIDVMVKEIEERSAQKNTLQMTPLLNFVFAQTNLQREKRFAQSSKKSDKARVATKKSIANKSAAAILKKEDRNKKEDGGRNKKDGIARNRKDGGRNKNKDDVAKSKKDETIKNKKDDIVKNKKEEVTRKSTTKEEISKNINKKEDFAKTAKDDVKIGRNRNRNRNRDSTKSTKDDGKNKKSTGTSGTTTNTTKKEDAVVTTTPKKEDAPSATTTKVPTTSNELPKSTDTHQGKGDDKSSSQKKKVVKKIIKIKKVKSKTDDASGEPSSHTHVTNTNGKDGSVTKPPSTSKGPSESSTSNASKSSSSVNQVEGSRGNSNQTQPEQRSNNNQAAQNEDKGDSNRSRKGRPDQAIYRPGSLKSRRPGPSATSSTSSKKTKD